MKVSEIEEMPLGWGFKINGNTFVKLDEKQVLMKYHELINEKTNNLVKLSANYLILTQNDFSNLYKQIKKSNIKQIEKKIDEYNEIISQLEIGIDGIKDYEEKKVFVFAQEIREGDFSLLLYPLITGKQCLEKILSGEDVMKIDTAPKTMYS